jgi:Domain of unknown function (DUF4286)
MILYNVTIKVHKSIQEDWLVWLKEIHIPEIISTECFTHFKILQLLEIDNSEGLTYAVQYFAESKSLYNRYIEKYAENMRTKSYEKWGDKFIAFRSVMQIVD